jgi:hypothetical protein
MTRPIAELWERCARLAEEEDILGIFSERLRGSGFAGDPTNAEVIFLAMTSRLLTKPVSLVIKGASATGKSYVLKVTLAAFPSSAYYALTGMSEKALFYSQEQLSHRSLVIYEAAALSNDFTAYGLRSLLSEGHLRYEYTDFEHGRTTTLIEKEGPTNLLVTTTRLALERELETRLISLNVPEDPKHQRAVLMAIASEDKVEVDWSDFHALQDYLAASRPACTIPFARELARLVPTAAPRMNRDLSSSLGLIRSHALLHGASRERTDEGAIVADLEDYAAVAPRLQRPLSEGLEQTVPDGVRAVVEAAEGIAKLNGNDEPITISALAEKIERHESVVRRHVYKALDRGFLENSAPPKRPMKLRPAEALPADQTALPDVEELAAACTRACTEDSAERLF